MAELIYIEEFERHGFHFKYVGDGWEVVEIGRKFETSQAAEGYVKNILKRETINKKQKDKEYIGSNIKNARKRVGISEAELAELVKVDEKDISNWERGECTPPLEIFIKICIELNVSADKILGLQ